MKKSSNKVTVTIQAMSVSYSGDAEGANAVLQQFTGLLGGMVGAIGSQEQPALPRKRRKQVAAEIGATQKAVRGPGE